MNSEEWRAVQQYANQLAVVTDFDGTLMHQDVGDEIMHALGVFREPAAIEASGRVARREIGSMEWIKVAYSFLAGRKEEVDRVIANVHPRRGALDFLRFCREHGIPVTILSDGMEYYITEIVRKFGIRAERIIANPIRYREDGTYELGLQNPNEACRWCGCCKAAVVRQLKAEGYRIVYIGDGTSDYYGSSFADWVFARGSLERYLRQEGTPHFRFETFDDVLAELQPNLDAFRQGTMPRRLRGANAFCRF
jgi:2-hydroxy-3-keto-5-methylthiopentenyl-1-phosphate phosphatase